MSTPAGTIERTVAQTPSSRGGLGSALRAGISAATGRWGLRGLAILYLGLLVMLPAFAIVTKGFSEGLVALRGALGALGARQALELTLEMAFLTAIINGVFGTLLAFCLTRYRFPGRGLVSAIVDVPFAIPTLVTGVMLVALYGPNSPIGGFLVDHGIQVIFARLGILLALLFVTLPLVVRTVQPVLMEMDQAEEEAAQVLGASRWTTFRKVVLPHVRPGIVAGSLLVFARALGEFGAVVVVSGNILGSTLTAPVLITQLTSQSKPEEAAAIATLLFGLSFVLVLSVEWLTHRRGAGA